MSTQKIIDAEIRHFHLFCGLGGGAKGFSRGSARVGNLRAKFRCIGGVDSDPAAIADFGRLAGTPGTVLDLFSREQFTAFHGREPGREWREATTDDIRRAAGGERPHIVFLSAPCKGFSGLLSETASRSAKYQALNGLTLRGVWLMLEAWKDDPPELIVFENVPRIAKRGRHLLDQIVALLRSYGYAVAETTHDCGELGGLAQSRKRFLLVARHTVKVPPFLYEPTKRPLRGVGEVLEKLPVPGAEVMLPMHRMPALQWRTWVRLAFVEAGSDWRSLNRLSVQDGVLADFGIAPETEFHNGSLGVKRWDEPAGTITSNGRPGSGSFSVADPRPEEISDRGCYGVGGWQDPAATITSQRSPGQGRFAVADPRVDGHPKSVQIGVRPWHEPAGVITGKMFVGGGPNSVADPRLERVAFNHVYRVVDWREPAPAVAGSGGPAGGLSVADPRCTTYAGGRGVVKWEAPTGAIAGESLPSNGKFAVADPRPGYGADTRKNVMRVTPWTDASGTVTSGHSPSNGALAVADPRPEALSRDDRAVYLTQGHYGVVPWQKPSSSVTASGQHDNGSWSVADPRDLPICAETKTGVAAVLPAPAERLVCLIRALDGTWHRPFTTLELAAIQSLVDPEEFLELHGLSDSAWRERIGNAVPPEAAQAIASVMGRTLLMAWSGQTFTLSSEPIWVQPIALALAVPDAEGAVA